MFSGPIAAHAYQKLAADGKPDVVVLFGPNHTGYGSGLALMNEGVWRTPLGDVEIDKEIANKLLTGSSIIDIDDSAHRFEHSIEVQLPFLQYLYGSDFKFVPLCFLMQDLSSAREVGQCVAQVLRKANAIIIASSDMTHYDSQERAEKKDRTVLKAVEAMDEVQFNSIIETHGISVCGYGPISALMVASKLLQVKRTKLLCYKTSGDITGDYSSVVGYASMCFMK
jgi:AmmeMemoRadiSam system protein B